MAILVFPFNDKVLVMSKYWSKKLKYQLGLIWLEIRERVDELAGETRRALTHRSFYQNLKAYMIKKKKTGFTMIELMVVLVIVGVTSTGGAVVWQSSQAKARDATRKADLSDIKIALEEYYNDSRCYPAEVKLSTCGGSELAPYIKTMPCDPRTDDPYLYKPLSPNQCRGYRLYAQLENDKDDAIAELGCDGEVGCGWADTNYGIAAGTTVYDPVGDAAVEPSPRPSSPVVAGVYACDPTGACNQYEDPASAGCPISFGDDQTCQNSCGMLANRCDR